MTNWQETAESTTYSGRGVVQVQPTQYTSQVLSAPLYTYGSLERFFESIVLSGAGGL